LSSNVKKLGIYGGTFDPIHNGHLRVVVELLSRKIVDQIILIPAGEPRLREQQPIVDGASRLEMCELAINDLPRELRDRVSASDIEIKRSGSTYAIDTVEELEKSGDELYWIIGSDAYAKVDQWHRSEDLKEKVSFIVIDRPGAELEHGIDIGALDISATEIRTDINKNREPVGVSPSVRKYIAERKLYAGK
jgi:nicotinate-nucleotide adenylyltransferase